MNQNIVKGVIKSCKYEKKYDLNGIEYKDYLLTIANQQYTAKVTGKIYLEDGMKVILQIKEDSANEAISGYCVREGEGWGPNHKILKNKVISPEQYDFIEGTVLEKRKSTTGSIYMNRSAISNRGSRISYTIVLENKDFHASMDEGEYLQVGMNIAVVLHKKDSVIILDKGADKFLGLSKPYFIIFLLAIILFNGYMYFSNQTPFINSKLLLVVVNIFLLLGFLLSLATFRTTNSAKKFLLSEINK